jgi:hypothetical protein
LSLAHLLFLLCGADGENPPKLLSLGLVSVFVFHFLPIPSSEELLENGLSPAAFKTFRHCVVDITSKVLVFAQQLGFDTSSLRDLKRKGLSTGFCQDGMSPWPTTSHLTLFHGSPQTCIPHIVAAPDVDAQVTFATVVDHLCADLRYR